MQNQTKFKRTEVGEIPEDWEVGVVGDHFSVNTGKGTERLDYGLYPVEGGTKTIGYTNNYLVDGDSILTGRVGTLGGIRLKKGKYWVSDNTIYIQAGNFTELNFLYYFLQLNNFKNLNVGSTQPLIKQSDIKKICYPKPPKHEEQEIVSILSSLDDKIELNRRMNQTLEEMGKSLFKHWFVDFEFPNGEGKPYKSNGGEMVGSGLGEIPKGWEVKRIEKVCCEVSNGGTPSRGNTRYWDGGHINWYKTGELCDTVLFESGEKITTEGLEKSSAKLLPKDSIVVAIYAAPTVGRLGILKSEAATNQACTGLVADRNLVSHLHIYYWLLSNRDFYNRVATGAAQQNISRSVIADTLVVLPTKETIDKSYKYLGVLWDKITANEQQISYLGQIRDALLPRLMSGRLRV